MTHIVDPNLYHLATKKHLREFEQLQAKLDALGWRPVSKGLPKQLTLIVACILRPDKIKLYGLRQRKAGNNGVEWYNERGESTRDMRGEEENITHWMPIPELPKEEPKDGSI